MKPAHAQCRGVELRRVAGSSHDSGRVGGPLLEVLLSLACKKLTGDAVQAAVTHCSSASR